MLGFLLTETSCYCNPSNTTCWPSNDDINQLRSLIKGTLLTMDDNNLNVTEFDNYCQPRNNLVDAKPYFILLPGQGEMSTIDDIQTSLNFIRKHNILLSIFSTGHSYIGRSSGKYNNSFQINFKNHKNIGYTYSNNTNNNLMLNSSYLVSVTVETGVNFEQLYSAINKINIVDSNKYNYLITGGECHTVGVGGYYLGGGHSQLSPCIPQWSNRVTE